MNTHTPSSITLYRVMYNSLKLHTLQTILRRRTEVAKMVGMIAQEGLHYEPPAILPPVHATTDPTSLQLARIILLSMEHQWNECQGKTIE
jgi:hypothetical protein